MPPLNMTPDVQRIVERIIRPDGGIIPTDVPYLRGYVETLFDVDELDHAVSEFQHWYDSESAPVFLLTMLHRPPEVSALVAGIFAARFWEREYPQDSSFTSRGGLAYFARFALDLATLHWHRGIDFSPEEIRYLRKLTNGNSDRAVIHELSTTRYFISRGAEVDPRFLRIGSREELIVHWDSDEFHVQCKSKPPGAGRTVDPELVQRLAAGIGVDAGRSVRSPQVEVETTGRMVLADVEAIRSAVRVAPMNSEPLLVTSGNRTFAVKVSEIQASYRPVNKHFSGWDRSTLVFRTP